MESEFVRFSCMLADTAGQIALKGFRSKLDLTEKSDSSPVSQVDLCIEREITNLISRKYPQHGIMGEEYGVTQGSSPYEWVIDPIDGTSNFIAGKPCFTTLISLLFEGQPILGVIDQPITKERWIGQVGVPTLFNSLPCGSSLKDEDGHEVDSYLRLACTTPFMFQADEYQVFKTIAKIANSVSFGGDAYNYGLLALGHIDIVMEADLKFYDIAALIPVVEGAGGVITDWRGRSIGRNSFDGQVLASKSITLHKKILDSIPQST